MTDHLHIGAQTCYVMCIVNCNLLYFLCCLVAAANFQLTVSCCVLAVSLVLFCPLFFFSHFFKK